MFKIKEIAFTAYPVTDVARARKFYEETLGLVPTMVFGEGAQQWVEYDVGQATLAIGNFGDQWAPGKSGGSVSLEVDNFDQAMQDLKGKGVSFYQEPFESPVCQMAFVSDPDGNAVGLHHRKAAAS